MSIFKRVARLFALGFLLGFCHITWAQTFAWNGAFSSDWATATNWTPNGIPGPGSTVNINSDAMPNPCVLDGDRSIAILNVSAGELDLNGFELTTTTRTTITGGVVGNGSFAAVNITNVSGATFNGAITMVKTGGGNNNLAGGNTFNGPLTIINNGGGRIRMSNTTGDTYNDDVVFVNNTISFFDVAFNGTNQFNGNVTLNCTGTGRISMGARNLVSATSTIAAGGALLTSGFNNAQLLLRRVTQEGSAANGSFTPTTATVADCTFGGAISIQSSSTTLTVTNTLFESDVTLTSATNLSVTGSNSFSTNSGTATLTRAGGGTNLTWAGPNTFGNLILTNSGTGYVRLAGTNGDTFLATSIFNNTNSGGMQIAHNGANSFAGNITLNNTGTGAITVGGGTGTSEQTSGALLSDAYSGAALTINRFTQQSTAVNDTLRPTTFSALNSTFNGNFAVLTTSTTITLNGCSFTASNLFEPATSLLITNANSFSTTSGTTTFTVNGAVANAAWTGGNTFGNLVINNNSTRYIRMAATNGDIFNGTAVFNMGSSGAVQIAYNGSTTFNDNITINNTGTGALSFGLSNGSAVQTAGSLLSSGFTGGSLIINRFNQQSTAANSFLNPTTFSALNTTFNGNFSLSTSTGTLTLNGCSFTANNALESASAIVLTNANNLSTVSGSTSFVIGGGGSTTWTGGNTFGPLSITHNSTGYLRMGGTNPDIFTGTATFQQLGTGALHPAYNNDNTFEGNISTVGTSSPITFGANTGRVILNASVPQTLSGNPGQPVVIRRLTMNTGAGGGLVLDAPLDISVDLNLTSGIIQTTATNILTLTDETASTTVGSTASFVQGPMQYTMNSNSTVRSALNFPIGKAADWRPVVLEVAHTNTTPYTYRAEMFNESAWDLGWTTAATARNVSDIRYWDVTRFATATMIEEPELNLRGGASGPRITLYFGQDDLVVDGADLVVVKNTPAEPTSWIDIGGTGAPAFDEGNLLEGSVTSTSNPSDFNSFSIFSLGSSGANPLPVTLVYFQAEAEQQLVNLRWETATEVNSREFVVERSTGGERWETLGSVPAAGNSTQPIRYQLKDEKPFSGWNYYRLRQIDLDGTETLSGLQSVFLEKSGASSASPILLYPNPGKDVVFLRAMPGVPMGRWMRQELNIYQSTGQLARRQVLEQGLDTPVRIAGLEPGVYILELSSDADRVRLPLMVE